MAKDDTGATQRGYSGASAAVRRRGIDLSALRARRLRRMAHEALAAGIILVRRGHIVGIAFATRFGSLGEPFLRHRTALSPLEPRRFEIRHHVYNRDALLVYARLFGGHYAGAVERALARFDG